MSASSQSITALREPSVADWPQILSLANRSVAKVAGAGPQDEWLRDRPRPREIPRHFVATRPSGIAGTPRTSRSSPSFSNAASALSGAFASSRESSWCSSHDVLGMVPAVRRATVVPARAVPATASLEAGDSSGL
jgi:hypothetical protein